MICIIGNFIYYNKPLKFNIGGQLLIKISKGRKRNFLWNNPVMTIVNSLSVCQCRLLRGGWLIIMAGMEWYVWYISSHYTPFKPFNTIPGAPEWCSGLRHCISVLEASLQTVVRFQAVSQLAVIGSPIGQCTIGPASLGLGCGRPLL